MLCCVLVRVERNGRWPRTTRGSSPGGGGRGVKDASAGAWFQLCLVRAVGSACPEPYPTVGRLFGSQVEDRPVASHLWSAGRATLVGGRAGAAHGCKRGISALYPSSTASTPRYVVERRGIASPALWLVGWWVSRILTQLQTGSRRAGQSRANRWGRGRTVRRAGW